MKKLMFILITLLLAMLAVWKLSNDGKISIGHTNSEFDIIKSGTYEVGKHLQLSDGDYAIYALSSQGEVIVNNIQYRLDSALYKKANKQPQHTRDAVIYAESPKIKLTQGMTIEVKGDDGFSISFMKR